MEHKKNQEERKVMQEYYHPEKSNFDEQEDSGKTQWISNADKSGPPRNDDGSPEDNRRGDARSRYGEDAPE